MIHHEKFSWIHFPKTGGNTVVDILTKNYDVTNTCKKSHGRIHDTFRFKHNVPTDRTILGNIRNPFDFYVSAWSFSVENRNGGFWARATDEQRQAWNHSFASFLRDLTTPNLERVWRVGHPYTLRRLNIGTYTGLLLHLFTASPRKYAYRRLETGDEVADYYEEHEIIDFYIRSEQLIPDLKRGLDMAGVDSLPVDSIGSVRKNQSTIRKPDYRDHYTPELIERVLEKDRFALEKFGYTFE